jgi:hypothetical protein
MMMMPFNGCYRNQWHTHLHKHTHACIHTYQVDEASEGGWSALHVAGIYNSAISAAAAIDSNADVFQRDVSGRTPLHMAASNDAVETLTHMVAHAKRGLLDEVIQRERESARARETRVRARERDRESERELARARESE